MNTFSVTFHSIHFPYSEKMDEIKISADGAKKLQTLFSALKLSAMKSRNKDLFRRSLNDSIFGCCISDGYVLLKSTVSESGSVSLHGFLIRNDESLRTAWKLVRIQTMIMCAMGWAGDGIVTMTVDEIRHRVSSAKFAPDYQRVLQETAKQLRSAHVPYNFALSNYPVSKLPLNFTHSGTVSDTAGTDIKEGIVFNQKSLSIKLHDVKFHHDNTEKLFLKRITPKDYYAFVEIMTFDKKELKEKLRAAKEETKQYESDSLWCFHYHGKDLDYYRLADIPVHKKLQSGMIPVADLLLNAEKTEKYANKYFIAKQNFIAESQKEALAKAQHAAQPSVIPESAVQTSAKTQSAEKEEEPAERENYEIKKPHGLFFGLFSGRKKD